MPKKQPRMSDIYNFIEKMPYTKFKMVVEHYSKSHKTNFDKHLDEMVSLNFQQRLEKLEINNQCPYCESGRVSPHGARNNIKRFRCCDCQKTFTLFSGTILERTKWHWDIWVKVLELTINKYSLPDIKTVLENDFGCTGINYRTLFLWRHKLLYAISRLPQPKLSGVVQIDETFVRESQKGSRTLVSFIDKQDVREPRYGRQASKFGVMGPEFATITTAISNTGHCSCKVTGLGRLTKHVLVDLFEHQLDNPSFVCTDANPVYEEFCNLFNIPHYERPSNYLTIIQRAGYTTPTAYDPAMAQVTRDNNDKILSRLYDFADIDKITNRGVMTYEAFKELKTLNGLSLSRVNELHSGIKSYIYGSMKNVSTKYLQDYVGFYAYMRNWKADHGTYPSSRKDAEAIFIEIIKAKVRYTTTDVENTELELPKPSPRYITLLKQETERMRQLTANKYFKFDEEDNVVGFDKRKYLDSLPKSKLYVVCKDAGMKKYKQKSIYSVISEILRLPNIADIIAGLIEKDRHYTISDEDLEMIKSDKYRH